MNPYVIGGVAIVIAILGWSLKSSLERNGELTAKLEIQANETLEAADANDSNQITITELEERIIVMIEERRVDTVRREEVLEERAKELLRARARADRLQDERDDEIDTNPDCADLTSLSLDMFCPNTAQQLRDRPISAGSNGDTDG